MTKTIHHGRNVKRFREMFQIKQEGLAYLLGEEWTQKRVSALEQREVIDDGLLEELAKHFKVTAEAIKNFDEEQAVNIITNNSFENCSQPASIFYNSTINPIEEIRKLHEEKIVLFERMLKEKDDMIDRMEKFIEKIN